MSAFMSRVRNKTAYPFRSAFILASLLVASAPMAGAAPITGSISLGGTASYTTNSLSFPTGSANISSTAQSGSFTALSGCTGCVSASNIASFSGFAGPRTIFSDSVSGFSVILNSISSVFTPGTPDEFLDLRGLATLHLSGYDDTAGILRISVQGPKSTNVTFSATARSVPEPASVLLLGVGIAGIGVATGRRGRSKA